MGLGAICADQATRGIPGPPGHVPVAPFQMAGKGGDVEGQEAPPTRYRLFSSDNLSLVFQS